MTIIQDFMKYRYLLYELVKKDIKLKYRRSYLGLVWTLLEPVLTTLVLNFVFSSFYSNKDDNFVVYILTGRLLYSFFSGSTKASMRSIRSNSAMIKKVYVPKYIYPLASVLSNFIIFALSLLVLVGACLVKGIPFTLLTLQAIIPIFVLLVLSIGTGLLLSTFAVKFRDLEYLWDVILMLIMYCSAIFYQADKMGAAAKVIKLNPLYAIIANLRNVVIYNTQMNMKFLAYSAGISIIVLAVGSYAFAKQQDKFILHI